MAKKSCDYYFSFSSHTIYNDYIIYILPTSMELFLSFCYSRSRGRRRLISWWSTGTFYQTRFSSPRRRQTKCRIQPSYSPTIWESSSAFWSRKIKVIIIACAPYLDHPGNGFWAVDFDSKGNNVIWSRILLLEINTIVCHYYALLNTRRLCV